MLLRNALLTVGITVGLGAFGIEIAACSSAKSAAAPDSDGAPPKAQDSQTSAALPACTDGGLTIAFNPMYSGYDGTHKFQIPAVVTGSNEQVTWSADSSMVQMQADVERPNEVLITVLKAGVTSIVAVSADGSKCASAPLTITAAKETDWEIGKARYNDGTSLHLGAAARDGGGSALEPGSGMPGPQCTNCHGVNASNGLFRDVSHTPEQTGGFSDADLLNIIVRGTFPPGAYFDDSIVPYTVWQTWHKWTDITADQQPGIIVYLRSLTPVPQNGAVNFGVLAVDAGSPVVDLDAASESGAGMDAATESGDAGAGSDDGSEAPAGD